MRFLPAPTPERHVAVLAQVHKALGVAEDDLDMDPALAACVQFGLVGPHLAPSLPTQALDPTREFRQTHAPSTHQLDRKVVSPE